MRAHVHLLLILLLLCLPMVASAEDKQPLYEVALKTHAEFPDGKTAFVEGLADATGDRFQFPGTDIMQPIVVSVFTKNNEDSVRLRLVKDSWDEPEREGITAGGRADFKFRTHEGFRVWVTSEQETPYQLLVWIGDEVVLPPPPATIPMSDFRKLYPEAPENGTQFSTTMLALLLAAGLAAMAGLYWLLKKRKSIGVQS